MGKSARLENEYGAEMLRWEFDSPVHRQFGEVGTLASPLASKASRGANRLACRFNSCPHRQFDSRA